MILIVSEYVREKVEGSSVTPLQVIYEDCQGVFLTGQAGEETVEDVMEPVKRFNRG